MPFTENQGARLFWREAGAGEPLLMIMGLGYSSEMWHHIETELAAHYRLLMFDNRGVGQSEIVPGPHLIPTMASDAAAVLDAANVESAHVFGISMGGYIAQEFALQYPERVRSLILGCTSCGGKNAAPAAKKVLKLLVTRAELPAEEGIRSMIPYVYDPKTPPERVEADMEIRLRSYPAATSYKAQLDGIFQWESYSRLGQLQAPTLVIHGEHDELVPADNARILAENISGAELVMLPDASHIFFTDQPERTVASVLNFLAKVRPCPGDGSG